jgi:hypothetical protein
MDRMRQPHQYQNRDRVLIQVVAERAWIRHIQGGGFVLVKNRFSKVEAAFAAPLPQLEGDSAMEAGPLWLQPPQPQPAQQQWNHNL